MKVWLHKDEWYPVYSVYAREPCDVIETFGSHPAEVSEETLARWDRIMAEFNAMQDEMIALLKEQS